MEWNESQSPSVSRRGDGQPGSDPRRTVVWVRGEQDLTTLVHLSVTIAHAARLDDADVLVDLSGVTFLDATTIGALVFGRNDLRARSRCLSVRAPSPQARRLLGVCGLQDLIDESAPAQSPKAPALSSWVEVPARNVRPDAAPSRDVQEAASPEPVRATARRSVEAAESVPRPHAPS